MSRKPSRATAFKSRQTFWWVKPNRRPVSFTVRPRKRSSITFRRSFHSGFRQLTIYLLGPLLLGRPLRTAVQPLPFFPLPRGQGFGGAQQIGAGRPGTDAGQKPLDFSPEAGQGLGVPRAFGRCGQSV
jgi:hypothetical protein